MRCPNCQSEIPEGKQFCGYCGQRLTAVKADVPASAGAPTPVPEPFDDEAPTRLATPAPEETPVESQPRREETPEEPEAPRPVRPAPAPVPRPKPAPKRRSRWWVWAIIAVAIVILIFLALLNANEPEPYQSTHEYIDMFEYRDEIYIRADQVIVLGGNAWIADTRELVAEYIESMHIEITLDGDPLPDPTGYWGQISEWGDYDSDGDADYSARWEHDLGTLSPGTHQLEITVQSLWAVTDGFDTDGDGELDEFNRSHENQLSIIVEE